MNEKTRVPLTLLVLGLSWWTLLNTVLRPRLGIGTLLLTSGLTYLIRWIYQQPGPSALQGSPTRTRQVSAFSAMQEATRQAPETMVEPVDLQVIEGIGPVISDALHRNGVHTYDDLANMDPDGLDEILRKEGIRRLSDINTWPEQARLAALGDWEGLDKLRGKLQGGRRE